LCVEEKVILIGSILRILVVFLVGGR